jgi:hypothetical protein
VCPLDTYCTLEPASGKYGCEKTCAGELVCGFNSCCPVGTRCRDDACPVGDLTVDVERIQTTTHVDVVPFAPDACELEEQCVGAPGDRTLLRFDLRIPNIGAADVYLGNPEGNPLFKYSPCHKHYHFQSFADYRLLDQNGKEVAFGHKQAFCLEDSEPVTMPPTGDAKYTCKFQGVQAGWADVYASQLPCQWVDVTGVPPGKYTLRVAINYAKILMETSFDNNQADVEVVIPPNTCPNGCKRVDAKCCQPGDPCGWANNGSCDCGDHFGWDAADCAACIPPDKLCLADLTCPRGCSANSGPCCADGDPCGLANNFACDCEDKFAWDDADCKGCNNPDPPCPTNTCPNGCTSPAEHPQCCAADNPCGWGTDGYCDCSGLYDWDAKDCAHCTTVSPSCP